AIFGNFVNRVTVLTHKYYNGNVPEHGELTDRDLQALEELKSYPGLISNLIEKYRFREAAAELIAVARLGNKYLADEEPWKVVKQDPQREKSIMYVSLQIATALAVLSEPFLPFTSIKLKGILAFEKLQSPPSWEQIKVQSELLPSGHTIGESVLLFSKIEDEQIQKQLDKLEATKKKNQEENLAANAAVEPQKDTIEFDDFTKLDIRTGTILEAQKMP